MIISLFSLYISVGLRLFASFLVSLAFGLGFSASLFLNSTPIDFVHQSPDVSLSYSDSNHSKFGHLPTANPITWAYKNPQSNGDADQPVDWVYRKIWAVSQEIQLVDFDSKKRFDSILTHLHISHFYF